MGLKNVLEVTRLIVKSDVGYKDVFVEILIKK
jgi:hypothetical protein